MRNINELIGIIKGINFDGVINEKEVDRLQTWVNENRNLAIETRDIQLLKTVDSVLEDGEVSDEERNLLIAKCEDYKEASSGHAMLYELNGIIEGIICDGEVNESEVYRLRDWMVENGDFVRGKRPTAKLCELIDSVLEDEVVTKEEQQLILQMLSARIGDSKINTKIEYLCKQAKAHKNIGLDLIDLLDNEVAIDMIHDEAERQLTMALRSYTGSYVKNPEIVFVSLVLIAMLHYDAGNYYGTVRSTYVELYKKFPMQKIEGLIRTILNRYRVDEAEGKERIINVALLNAIVPGHYLKAFFEFIFDIYKLNFEYTLVEDLYEEFKFIYEGLRTSMLSDGDNVKINVTKKTYKLIKTTKQLIVNKNSVDAVINLSIIIIKLIDKRIWNKEIHIYNPYLKNGYDGWAATLKDDVSELSRKSTSDKFRSRWQPRFFWMNNEIYLAMPLHKVKSDYHYWEIYAVVENNGRIIFQNLVPDVREIIGGWRVSLDPIYLENPLGTLRYKLMAGSSVIYDSGEKLYREFLVFDSDGEEITNNTDYTGTAVFVYGTKQNNLSSHRSTAYYDIAFQNVHAGDTCLIGNTVFNFSALFKPGIFGDDYPDHRIINDVTGKEMAVYKATKMLIFESDQLDATFEIIQDGIPRRLSDFKYKVSAREGVNKYVIDLPALDVGMHSFVVNQISKGKKYKILDFPFAIDRSLDVKTQKLNDETYYVSIMSSFSSLVECEVTTETFDLNGIPFTYNGKKYHYCIPFGFEFYRLSGQCWKSLKNGLWVGELTQDSTVEVYGTDIDGLIIYSSIGRPVEDVPKIRTKGSVQIIPVGFLASFKNTYDYVVMMFTKGGHISQALFCDYKCNLNDNATDIMFDPVEKKLSVVPFYNGRGQVFISLIDKAGNIIVKSSAVKSGELFTIESITSFEEYTIRITEKEPGLSLKPERLMKEYKRTFYAWNDFIGSSFKIAEIEYNNSYSNPDEMNTHKYTSMRMEFVKKLSEDTYEGKIYMDGRASLPQYQRLNPVIIHINGNIIDGLLDVSVTKNGYSLMTEESSFGLTACSAEPSHHRVTTYTIEMSGAKKV